MAVTSHYYNIKIVVITYNDFKFFNSEMVFGKFSKQFTLLISLN